VLNEDAESPCREDHGNIFIPGVQMIADIGYSGLNGGAVHDVARRPTELALQRQRFDSVAIEPNRCGSSGLQQIRSGQLNGQAAFGRRRAAHNWRAQSNW